MALEGILSPQGAIRPILRGRSVPHARGLGRAKGFDEGQERGIAGSPEQQQSPEQIKI